MIIRKAETKDLDTLKEFEQEIIRYERLFAPNLKKDPITYYNIKNLIERESAYLVVAVVNNKIIGSGYALIETSKPYIKPNKYAYLGFMYVLPEYRGKGVNGQLIDHLLDWAKSRGLTEIQLDVYAENKSALSAYKKKGFAPNLLKMRLNTEKQE